MGECGQRQRKTNNEFWISNRGYLDGSLREGVKMIHRFGAEAEAGGFRF